MYSDPNNNEDQIKNKIISNMTLCKSLFFESTCGIMMRLQDDANRKINQALSYLMYCLLIAIMFTMGRF